MKTLVQQPAVRTFMALILFALGTGWSFGGTKSGLKVDIGDTKDTVRNEYGAGDWDENIYGRLGLEFKYDKSEKVRIISAVFHRYGVFYGKLAGVSLGDPLDKVIQVLGKPLEQFGDRGEPGSKKVYAVWKLRSDRFLFVELFASDNYLDPSKNFLYGAKESTKPGLKLFREGSVFHIKLCTFRCELLD